jgi:hypothetical protein
MMSRYFFIVYFPPQYFIGVESQLNLARLAHFFKFFY